MKNVMWFSRAEVSAWEYLTSFATMNGMNGYTRPQWFLGKYAPVTTGMNSEKLKVSSPDGADGEFLMYASFNWTRTIKYY
jgi:hypothetical protein